MYLGVSLLQGGFELVPRGESIPWMAQTYCSSTTVVACGWKP
jgi:hypothetical protein